MGTTLQSFPLKKDSVHHPDAYTDSWGVTPQKTRYQRFGIMAHTPTLLPTTVGCNHGKLRYKNRLSSKHLKNYTCPKEIQGTNLAKSSSLKKTTIMSRQAKEQAPKG